jgi:mannan endo-1,4-beta-mannosidase
LSGTGRYVRMYGTARGTSWGYSLWEFDVYGTPASPPPGSTPPPSSIYWGALMDGNETYDYYYGPSGFWQDAPWGNTGNTWDKFESNTGKKVSLLHYGQPNPWLQTSFDGKAADLVTNRGAIPEIDMSSDSTSLADIANGVYDNSIKAWANNVKAWGKPFFLRWDWEMNGTWFGWGSQAQANPAAFVAMWRHFHDVVVGQGATNVTWVWCPNLEFSGSTPLSQLYPGDAYVDWTCLDGYNRGATSQSFTSLYQKTYNHLLEIAPSKPIMIGEVGSLEYGSGVKAAWITDMLKALPSTFPRIKAMGWFNWRIDKGGGVYRSWPIESSASSQSAFAAGIASPYYAPNNFRNLPPLTKVKPLP